MEKKKCSVCLRNKEINEFWRDKKTGKYHSVCKECHTERSKRERLYRKIILVKRKGGECSICGYKRNLSALEFHHVKDKNIDRKMSFTNHNLSWDFVQKEVENCVLLCSVCHAEIHHPELKINDFDDKYFGFDIDIKECPICGETTINNKYCSKKCASTARRKVKDKPKKEELNDLLKKNSYCAVGRMFGVSDNAIRKWEKKYLEI